MSLFDRDRSHERMPVSVITGFLGSGKTTLLNHLLQRPELADSAVIINEFGEVGLDHLLIEAIDGEVAVLSSGCVCCTLRSDLEATLRDLLARRDRGEVPPFRRVLVETTGLADPAPIVQTLLNNPLVSRYVRLDSIVATVDAVNGGAQLDAHGEAVKQAAIADRIFITKTDIADEAARLSLEERLTILNPGASREAIAHGVVEPDRLFGAALFDPGAKSPDARQWLNEEAYHHHHHHHDGHSRHDSGISAFSVAAGSPLDWSTVAGWLGALRQWHGAHLLRVKGILDLDGENAPVAIHGIHHVFHPPVQLAAWPDGPRRSCIVFIVQGLDPDLIRGSWEERVVRSRAPAP